MQGNTSVLDAVSDEQLFILVHEGHYPAFKEIFDRYHSLLLMYAFRKLQDKDEAEDVVQEVFVHLWHTKSTLVISSSLSAYLYRAVLNRVLNALRHKSIDSRHIDQLQHLVQQSAKGTDYRVREKDIINLVEKEIEKLPPRMREVFELRKKEQLSNREVALRLNISEQTVATQMKKALRILRDKLGIYLVMIYMISK